MKALSRLAPAAVAAIALTAIAVPAASAATRPAPGSPAHRGGPQAGPAVFVMTDNTAANAVVAYHRAPGGALTLAGTYYTHGAARASRPAEPERN